MTRAELSVRLAHRFAHLAVSDAKTATQLILRALTDALAHGQRIEIRGFGSFALNHRPPRIARNPKTREAVRVPAKQLPHFKAGKALRERVNVSPRA